MRYCVQQRGIESGISALKQTYLTLCRLTLIDITCINFNRLINCLSRLKHIHVANKSFLVLQHVVHFIFKLLNVQSSTPC
jgi:hypothetical protein